MLCTHLYIVNDNYDGISITKENFHLNDEIPFSYKKRDTNKKKNNGIKIASSS